MRPYGKFGEAVLRPSKRPYRRVILYNKDRLDARKVRVGG